MKLAAIICEYNPFHNGHAWQISEVKRQSGADAVLLVMSGSFVQRGEPALFDLHTRTRIALQHGADLVLELPVFWSTHSAAWFAQGAVSMLSALNCVDSLWFGSEAGEIQLFDTISDILCQEPAEYQALLRANLKEAMVYPKARSQALLQYLKAQNHTEFSSDSLSDFLSKPNNILGLEYCIALKKEALRHPDRTLPRACTLLRRESAYHETAITGTFSSATAIRKAIREQNLAAIQPSMPQEAFSTLTEEIEKGRFLLPDDLSELLGIRLLTASPAELSSYVDVSPDLARRIYHHRFQFQSFENFIPLIKSRETTYSHVERALLHIALDIREELEEASWIRILGFRKSCKGLLKELSSNSQLPLITQLRQAEEELDSDSLRFFRQNLDCSNLYEFLLSQKTGKPLIPEEKRALIVI